MRITLVFGLLAATALTWRSAGAADFKPDSLYGTWERTVRREDGSTIRLMKIITPTHFAVFQQGKDAGAFQGIL